MTGPLPEVDEFSNQFLGIVEGPDGEFNPAFWDDPNNQFSPQPLPTWVAFQAAFPKHSDPAYDTPLEMYSSIGGEVYSLTYTGPRSNTCAIRLSKALNYSGVTIPLVYDATVGKKVTFLGGDGKYYFVNANAMNRWMRKTFGCKYPNTAIGEYSNSRAWRFNETECGEKGKDLPYLLFGFKGIYSMIPNDPSVATGFEASGHVDLISLGKCDGDCFFSPKGGIKYVDFWLLP